MQDKNSRSNIKRRYNNKANTKEGTDGQRWRRFTSDFVASATFHSAWQSELNLSVRVGGQQAKRAEWDLQTNHFTGAGIVFYKSNSVNIHWTKTWKTLQRQMKNSSANNLVPRAFPLKNGWGRPTHLREKPWGRGWLKIHNIAVVSSKAKLLWPLYTSIQAINFLFSFFFFYIGLFLPYYV